MPKIQIFISSVQSEFARERRLLADYLQHDTLFRKFCEVFIFEDIPAQDRTANDVYLEEVKKSDIYIGLFGRQFGFEFEDGTSPTEREFDCATAHNKYRLIYLSIADRKDRHPKMNHLIEKASNELVYSGFSSPSELMSEVYSSLVNYLVKNGKIRVEPFDKSKNEDATLNDISEEKIRWFVEKARNERAFPLAVNASTNKVLTHLNLVNDKYLTNAAVLLFGKQPQNFFISSEIKCAHFHGTKVVKPIPFYQVYKGNLFELVDQAVNFVLSKIDYAVGTRATGTQPPTAYEIPPAVIEEAVVNAVAHRDYDSTGSVQVMLFANRLEINPVRYC
jgi:ATP-dependent DNA helicase RecG